MVRFNKLNWITSKCVTANSMNQRRNETLKNLEMITVIKWSCSEFEFPPDFNSTSGRFEIRKSDIS